MRETNIIEAAANLGIGLMALFIYGFSLPLSTIRF